MSEVVIEQRSLENVDTEVLTGLEFVYAKAYHDSHMYEDLRCDIASQPEIFQLFLARDEDSIVGARVIESKEHGFIDYHGHTPVHGKRFSVLPEYRGQGIGAGIINAGNDYVFHELGLDVVFGESNEIGALSLYGRQGALYALGSIEKALRRNTPNAAQRLFAKFITDPELRELRLPGSIPGGHDAVQFAYYRNQEVEEEFRGHGFTSYSELLMHRLPDVITVSDDITLNTITYEDSDELFAIIERNSDTRHHVAWASNIVSAADVMPVLQRYSNEQLSGRYALRHHGKVVGYIGMSRGGHHKEYGIGYFLDHEYRGNGIVSTAIKALAQQARDQLGAQQVYLQIKPGNTDSIAVAKRLGFYPAETVVGKDFPVEQQRWRLDLEQVQ